MLLDEVIGVHLGALSLAKPMKISSFDVLENSWGLLGGLLDRLENVLGRLRSLLGRLGRGLEHSALRYPDLRGPTRGRRRR